MSLLTSQNLRVRNILLRMPQSNLIFIHWGCAMATLRRSFAELHEKDWRKRKEAWRTAINEAAETGGEVKTPDIVARKAA